MKKLMAVLASVLILAALCVTLAQGERRVEPWEEAADYCVEQGVITQAERAQISEENYWSKIEFLSMTAQVLGIYDGEGKPLYQTRDHCYNALEQAGIVVAGEFLQENWAKPIGRYEVALLCQRAAQYRKETVSQSSVYATVLSDVATIPGKYRQAVNLACGMGIMVGDDQEHRFDGWQGVTKAEGCLILQRLIDPLTRKTPWLPPAYNTLLSEFTTSYDAVAQTPEALLEYRENSVFNMMRAGDTLNGYILQGGQSFSFNQVIGNPGAAEGYKKGIIVSGGKHVPGYGGGVCQLSTTIFNAALRANMAIEERHNHGLKSIYVPAGADSAIYNPSLDLRFQNRYEAPVMFVFDKNEAEMTLTVRIYGSDHIAMPEVKLEIEEKGGTYLLKRYANGEENYTCKSRYRD